MGNRYVKTEDWDQWLIKEWRKKIVWLIYKQQRLPWSSSFVPKSTECYRDVNLILCRGPAEHEGRVTRSADRSQEVVKLQSNPATILQVHMPPTGDKVSVYGPFCHFWSNGNIPDVELNFVWNGPKHFPRNFKHGNWSHSRVRGVRQRMNFNVKHDMNCAS